MYVVTVTIQVKPGQMAAFLPKMTENARLSRETEVGCQQFDICRDGDTVFLYEVYDDRAAFDAHLATTHFQTFMGQVDAMLVDKALVCYPEVIR
ncbi:putative quinol monooxygenase [uncultured Pelagimonas sp.]|uniref:putative quinol monooxygenase n=1 Tax=uncultured Pelagimonas sp. TaxID=1618102 RepID=UPI002603F575|nr:putative quinol monooxygenase [uncultured Pelagimonas sp.]